MKQFFLLAGIAIVLLCQLSCSSDEEQKQLENPAVIDETSAFSGAPLLGDVVLENMYEDEARKLIDKTPVQIVTVIEGTNRVVLEARFRGVRDFGFGFPLYECELVDEAAEAMGGIAQGMSGSPVGPPGRIMGALAYGDAFAQAPTRFWVTSIDAMENSINYQTFRDMLKAEPAPAAPAGVINATYAPVKTPVMITGIQTHRLEQLASNLNGPRFENLELFATIGGVPAAPAAQTTRLAAGDMIGVAIATGDVVNAIGFGTVTQVYDDGTFVAFGHPMNGDGKSALPVYRAVTNGIVSNLAASYKSSSAYGAPIGKITKDLLPAIVGELGPPPPMIPVKVAYQAGNGPVVEKNHKLAYGQEWFLSTLAAATMGSIRHEIGSATLEGTVTLHFKETETVYTESFRSTSADPFGDIAQNVNRIVFAFTDLLFNSAGEATLTDVSISITDKPQIMAADVHEVIVPEERILPGENLTVSVVLLPHWTAVNGERTIQREVTLEIPEDFPIGDATLTVASGSPFGPPVPFGADFLEFDVPFDVPAEEEEPKLLPENLDELIKQMEDAQIDPSLITITLTASAPPPDLLPPEGFPFPENGEIPEGGDIPNDGEIPPELLAPEGLPPFDDFPPFEDFEPPPTVETTINLDGFIVTGFKDVSVTIGDEEMVDGMIPEDIEEPIEAVEPVEEE